MSRIGNQPINIPSGVTVKLDGSTVTVTGPKGTLTQTMPREIKITEKDNVIEFTRNSEVPAIKALHGLTRSLVNNMVEGVVKGFEKHLELVGTGYRVAAEGSAIVLSLGLSHPVKIEPESGISFKVEGNNHIIINGIDKRLVGQVAANIRATRKPDAYKGKGIRYQGEVVKLKPGKSAKAGA